MTSTGLSRLAHAAPRLLQLGAVVALAGAVAVGYVTAQKTASNRLALHAEAPAGVAIQDFDPARHEGPAGEATLLAQIDPDAAISVRYREGLTRMRAVVYPLLSSRAAGGAEPVVLGLVYYPDRARTVEPMAADTLLPEPIGEGAVGPVVGLSGFPGAPDALQARATEAFAAAGFALAPSQVALTPFPEGRAAALEAPVPSHMRTALFLLALVLMVSSVVLRHSRARRTEVRRINEMVRHQPPRRHRSPRTARAQNRFAPLAEQEELLPEPPAAPVTRLGRLRGVHRTS